MNYTVHRLNVLLKTIQKLKIVSFNTFKSEAKIEYDEVNKYKVVFRGYIMSVSERSVSCGNRWYSLEREKERKKAEKCFLQNAYEYYKLYGYIKFDVL